MDSGEYTIHVNIVCYGKCKNYIICSSDKLMEFIPETGIFPKIRE
jgi:hypothetical protein